MAALLNGHRHYLARALRAAIVPFFAARMLSIKPRTALMNIVVRIGVRGQSSIGLPVPRQSANRLGNSTTHTSSPSWLSVRRAASAPMSSWHVHAWLHWPKLSAIKNTRQGRGHAIVKHQRRFQSQGLQSFSGCVHRANCRFNADAHTPHRSGYALWAPVNLALAFS